MSIFSRAMDFFGLSDEGFEVEVEPQMAGYAIEEEAPQTSYQNVEAAPQQRTVTQNTVSESAPLTRSTPLEEKKVVSIRQQAARTSNKRPKVAGNGGPGKISILEPRSYTEVNAIAKHVLNGESVLINFQNMEEEQARRTVDFLTGAVYAQDGDIKRVGDEIFLCTPAHVEIEGQTDSLMDTDVYEV